MEPIRVDSAVLRGLLPDLRLTVGTRLAGRVTERQGDHGLLALRGALLVAQLPEGVEAGQRLRLAVAEIGEDRVVLQILPEPATAHASPTPAPAGQELPLPGGFDARVLVEGEPPAGGPDAAKAVTITYDSPALGRLEIRLALGARGIVAGVGAAAGEPVRLAGEHADALRAALSEAMRRPADVHVGVRRDRIDVRA